MSIFEIEKDALLQLSEEQLEELIARLAEAELALTGNSPNGVRWSGSINAPDGGVDVRVIAPEAKFIPGFLKRANTIFQAKKRQMGPSQIKKEMRSNNTLVSAILRQAEDRGSYIIVSLADDCKEPRRESRINAMKIAMGDDPNKEKIDLDFYDRSKLHQWLRRHFSVVLWVRDILGQPLSGWKPYGSWSHLPDDDDSLIMAPGVSVTLPRKEALSGKEHQELTIEDAIDPLRDLVRSAKIVRIIGLSGVGKTRIVQALFEDSVGVKPLDRTIAVYTNTGADPKPSASAMLERLIHEGRKAILVVDNCPSQAHSSLAGEAGSTKSNVKLITIEYDIREGDIPQATEVVCIKTDGIEVAERLLCRRFPTIGLLNARRIAEFADGNARVSLVLAEGVKRGQSLAHLSDADLFDRLFLQRKGFDRKIYSYAGMLSLVYSFSVSDGEDGVDELAVLGSFFNVPRHQLSGTVEDLYDQHIIQKRGKWRAVLPPAIANQLAGKALRITSPEELRDGFENCRSKRLMSSFARRLGIMHDHPVAQEIVNDWLQEGGLLGTMSRLDDMGVSILENIAPVAPDAVLDRIENEIDSFTSGETELFYETRMADLLVLLAYDPSRFERCIEILLNIADLANQYPFDPINGKIASLFQPYYSGTHASTRQRVKALRQALWSRSPIQRTIGFDMLSAALNGEPWSRVGGSDFGSQPRDFGFDPDPQQFDEWICCFIDVAVEAGLDDNQKLASKARGVLAQEFQGLWSLNTVRNKIVEAARNLDAQRPWLEGWRAVRLNIFLFHQENRKNIPQNLKDLEMELAPADLPSKVRAYVLGEVHYSLDDQFDGNEELSYNESCNRLNEHAQRLGEEFSRSTHNINSLGADLFSPKYSSYCAAFGRGLAIGASDKLVIWEELVVALRKYGEAGYRLPVFEGFIEQVKIDNRELATNLLDRCFDESLLYGELVNLHPLKGLDEDDFDRCMQAFDLPGVSMQMYEIFFRHPNFKLPQDKLIHLAKRMIAKPNGGNIVLKAFSTRFRHFDVNADFYRVGLMAATHRLLENSNEPPYHVESAMEQVVKSALAFDGNKIYKEQWINAIFIFVDRNEGMLPHFLGPVRVTASKMLEEFLDKSFVSDEEGRWTRKFFVRHTMNNRQLLSDSDVDKLISWCNQRSDPDAWVIVAASINPWRSNVMDESISFSESAVQLLEAAPDAKAVLKAYAEKTAPQIVSGSRARIMEKKAAFFIPLFEHSNDAISTAARNVHAELLEKVDRERAREQYLDETREQRFERPFE